MKTKSTKAEIATHQAKGKVKLQNLKLHKETIENLSIKDSGAIKGGARNLTLACGGASAQCASAQKSCNC